MNVLFVSPYPPFPPTFGGSVRIYNLMREAARNHRVFSLSFESTLVHEVDKASFEALCERIVEVPRHDLSKRWQLARSLVSSSSYQTLSHRSPQLQEALERLVAEEHIDVVVLEFSQMACVDVPGGPGVIIDEHNVEWDLLRREAQDAPTALRRLYQGREWKKFQREEHERLADANLVTVTSDRDRELLLSRDPELEVRVVANGVDTGAFAAAPGPGDADTLVFTGTMHYHPNAQAALHFVEQILPRIQSRRPEVRFVGAGGRVPPELARVASDTVSFTGYVDDIQEWFARAAVFVVPLRVGGGTRFKVVEALSCQRPVVSTSLGAEGIPVVDGEHLLLADDDQSFADAVLRLLEDREHADALASAGRRFTVEYFDWEVIGRGFDQALLDAADSAGSHDTPVEDSPGAGHEEARDSVPHPAGAGGT